MFIKSDDGNRAQQLRPDVPAGLHLNMVHGVSGPGLLSSVGRLSGLVSLSLTDALDARRVAAKHLRVGILQGTCCSGQHCFVCGAGTCPAGQAHVE
jgi:hypothetical protein